MIDQARLVRTFLDLVKINSPSRNERGIADYVRPRLEELGFDVREDDTGKVIGGNTGNLIATKSGSVDTGVRIFLSAHMDTVEATEGLEPVVTEDGVIKSDGKSILGADDKAAISVILEALQVVTEQSIPFRGLQVCLSVAEEIGIMGAKEISPEDIHADLGFVFDTERPVAGIMISAPSHENFIVKIHGRASHAGMHPEDGVSAIVAASNAISKMRLGRIDHETTANVGVIQGGKARNIIPDEVVIKAEARSRNQDKLTAQVDHMVKTFQDAAKELGADIEIGVKREYTTYRFTADDAPVRLAQRAARAIGIEPELKEAGGGSDANVFNEKGIPSVVIGVGYDGAHSRSERVAIDDLVRTAEFAVSLITESGKRA